MNILIIHYNSFLIEDLQQCMEQMGHNYKLMEADVIVRESDDNFGSLFDKKMESEKYDCVFIYKSTRYFPTCSHNFPKAGEARFQGRSRLFRLLGKFPYLGESRRILMAVSSKTSSKTRFYYAATRRISSAAVQPSIWA